MDNVVTRGLVWQDGNSDFGIIELRNVVLEGQTFPSITARIIGKNVRKTAKVRDGYNVLTYNIKLKVKLDDATVCANPLFYSGLKDTIAHEFESMIQSNLLYAAKVSKEEDVDFLQIREWFRKTCRRGYENFDLSAVEVEVVPSVTVKT